MFWNALIRQFQGRKTEVELGTDSISGDCGEGTDLCVTSGNLAGSRKS